MSTEQLTVIIPCKDEASNIERAVKSVYSVISDLDIEVHVLMIDDGSTDGTADVMERICSERSNCKRLVNQTNLGLGRTVLNSYHHIPEDHWVTVFPGDNELVFGSIRNLLALRNDYDLILGYLQNPVIRTVVRRVASDVFSVVVRFIYGYPYRYLNGMKLYKLWIFKDIDMISSGHAFNAELLAKAILRNPHLRVGEAPFVARGRSTGETKAFRFGSVLTAVRDVLAGYKSVCAYRDYAIRKELTGEGSHLDEKPHTRLVS